MRVVCLKVATSLIFTNSQAYDIVYTDEICG